MLYRYNKETVGLYHNEKPCHLALTRAFFPGIPKYPLNYNNHFKSELFKKFDHESYKLSMFPKHAQTSRAIMLTLIIYIQ